MSDTSSVITVENYDGQTLIIYNNRKPDVYKKDDVYDPDNPESGKYFPSLNSIVIDDGALWYVAERYENDFRVVLKPCCFVSTAEYEETHIVSYGNDKFCLYQDARTDPHKLVVDAKLLFYGNNLMEYALYRTDASGNEICISMYLDNTDTFISDRIPMQYISPDHPSYKWPTNCHTTYSLDEGEPIVCRVFNNLGNVAAEITLYVRNAVWWNDLSSHSNPIVGLDATCLQMRGNEFYLYPKQDPSHLNIKPYLTYADGTTKFINIDNIQCFLYGLDTYMPAYPGYSQTLLIKYFLNYREQAMSPEETKNVRFLTCAKNLVVVSNTNTYTVKLSVIPWYDRTNKIWTLRFFAYSDQRNRVDDVTALVTYHEEHAFDGTSSKWGTEQMIEVEYDMQSIFKTDDPLPGAQTFCVTVWDPDQTYERYTIRDSISDDHVFGVDGSITRRPIIHYDRETNMYFIPTSIFENWEAVLESFYHIAEPPYDPVTESEAPAPTHFLIRDVMGGQQLIGGPIPKSEYGQAWPILIGNSCLEGSTVVVEFLQQVNETFNILYGVPVDVVLSTTGYNTATNNQPGYE